MALQQSYPLTLYRDSLRGRLQELFSIGIIPSDFLQDIFEKVGIVFFSYGYDEAANVWSLTASLELDTEVSIQIPGLDQIKLLIGAKPESDSTNLIFNIAVNYSDA